MNKKCRVLRLAATSMAVMAAIGGSVSAEAQTVDYNSLESIFREPITTSAIGTPQRASDVPANMTIITADEIRQYGSRNIPEILRHVPGIDVVRSGEQSYDVGVRGYQQGFQPRFLVLLNGRQVFLDDYSRTDWNAIPVNIDDIRQIEVVKGPNAALFGNNAVGGVLNIITYNPLYDKLNVANVTTGTQSYKEASATVTRKLASWGGIKVSAGALDEDEFNTELAGPMEGLLKTDPKRRFASADAVFRLTSDTQGELETTYLNSKASGSGFNGLYSENQQEISSFKGMLASQTDYGTLKATSYLNHVLTKFSVINGPGALGINYLTNDLYVMQLEDQFRIGSAHTFRLAAEYRNNAFELYTAEQTVPQQPRISYNTISESAMWNWQIRENLNFTNAVRVDERQENAAGTLWAGSIYTNNDYNQYITGLNANSGLVLRATDIDTFRLTYGRGMQYPSFNETGTVIAASLGGPALFAVSGDPRLNPTIVTNYEFDYDREVKPLFSSIHSGVFYTQNKDIKSFILVPPTFPVVAQITTGNVGNSRAAGLELGLDGNHDGFRWATSYSLANVTDDPSVKEYLHYTRSAPQHSIKLDLGYSWKQWEFDGFGYYVSSRESLRQAGAAIPAPVVTTDGYASLSGRIGYNINDNLTLALSGTGLTRADTIENAYPATQRQVLLGLTGKF